MNKENETLGFETLSASMGMAVKYPAWIVQHFSPFISGRLLEVGVGFGNYAPLYPCDDYVGADIDAEVVAAASRLHDGMTFVQATLGAANFVPRVVGSADGELFDACVCFNTLQYLDDEQHGVSQLLDVLSVGGHVCLLIPAHQFLFGALDRGSRHRYRYSKSTAREICSHENATIVSLRFFNPVGGIVWGGYNALQFLLERLRPPAESSDVSTGSDGERGAEIFDRYLVVPSRVLQPFCWAFFGLSLAIVLQKTEV